MPNEQIIHWTSAKQTAVVASTCESELVAHVHGLKLGLCIRDLVLEFIGEKERVTTSLKGDNMAALHSIRTEIINWRTRHFAMHASWIREKITELGIDLTHVPGKELIADGLTKILTRTLLEAFRGRVALG